MTTPERRILLVSHASRRDAQELAAAVATRLLSSGIAVCAPSGDLAGTPLGEVPGVGAAPSPPSSGCTVSSRRSPRPCP